MSARRPLLLPLVPLYRAGLAVKNWHFDRNRDAARELRDTVISVGGLSAGGSGKTPFLIALATLMRELGYAPDVLSRGYGRTTKGVLRVDPQGTAAEFGDEPLLLARTLGAPVYVGAERHAAGLRAEMELPDFHRGVHLLDDGFAHRRLARTVDIVLLTEEDARDHVLPAGNLREPMTALRRADIVVLRAGESESLKHALGTALDRATRVVRIWEIYRRMTLPAAMPARPLVFSGIARPADFELALECRGVHAAATKRFRDHHRYTQTDVDALVQQARQSGADGFVTTSKDAVKLDDLMLAALRAHGVLAVADAVVTLVDRERCAEDLRQLLRERTRLGQHIVGPKPGTTLGGRPR
ncbi:tetraacyldisaccharide 4'-kinase [Terriglobus sp.]|uniref:tetraacyldisaccharide 4'-kinase n=1 Tax=Terriglobus sp. TaxID=1889013 RepID=UPI003B00E5A2